MNRLRAFITSAHGVSSVQKVLIEVAGEILSEEEMADMEIAILAGGYEGWEAKVLSVLKGRCGLQFNSLMAQGRPAQKVTPPSTVVADPTKPLLRVFICAKCQRQYNSVQPYGSCCLGMPECPGCGYQLHAADCGSKTGQEKKP